MIRIDPRVAVCWLTPTTVRIGRDRALATIEHVDPSREHALGLLRLGVSREHLAAVLGDDNAAALLAEVAGAVAPEARPLTIAVNGVGALANTIRGTLAAEGHDIRLRRATLLIFVSLAAVPASTSQRAMASDRVHLPVVVGDQTIEVGPLVVPGRSACRRCADLGRLDRDPDRRRAWGEIPETEPSSGEIAQTVATVAQLARAISRGTVRPGVITTIDRTTLGTVTETIDPHPQCGCGAARENGMAHDDLVPPPLRTTA